MKNMKKIAVIGAGPYGLMMLDQLIYQHSGTFPIELFIFDPDGPGGAVWSPKQRGTVLMNSVMQHVTLFSDGSPEKGRSTTRGPNLYEWCKSEAFTFIPTQADVDQRLFLKQAEKLQKNDCCERRFYGLYQRWFFQSLKEKLPSTIRLTMVPQKIMDLEMDAHITLFAEETWQVDQVILATGHGQDLPTDEEAELENYARKHQLYYQKPANPATVDLSKIGTKEDVIFRGVGLSFFDYVAMVPEFWGGHFYEEDGRLSYRLSGNEGRMIVGSGGGLPYHPRPVNQKEAGEDAQPQILTKERLDKFKPGDAPIFFDLMKKEAEIVYYQKKLTNLLIDVDAFLQDYVLMDRKEALVKHQVPKEDWLTMQELIEPAKKVSAQDFSSFVVDYLRQSIQVALAGNVDGPVAAAIDTLKEIQFPIHWMLDHQRFSADEIWNELWKSYNKEYGFITVGPPVLRTQQLLALVEAGLIVFLAPEMVIKGENGQFVTYSRQAKEQRYAARRLIEARIPSVSYHRTTNPLILKMKKRGYLAPHVLLTDDGEKETGALLVDENSHQVIDSQGKHSENLYCYGVPTEGIDWLNATTPRPKNNDRIFLVGKRIAASIYQKKS
ncbi:FAD(NAD)-dependent oxidoreductase [Enterococcus florum]|uniref:FAD(NAD)-dependent oxidoreductase n=1 Tax=Enterococcus florum TaxID=2480627 RepID=A0A4P5P3H7_9ENTE|nr:FAD/NAD(P)-binding protein [Enterococcus florum]GCF92295.1 FAD(NAD)-dependent oxidoreductase [Enterococcus florum]